jgi:hypothetical protein
LLYRASLGGTNRFRRHSCHRWGYDPSVNLDDMVRVPNAQYRPAER